ncbi:MAG: hypothetical protein M1836_002501 [Candelina mexicana]|nr:MAG: hypothetical protein M1836_002501 [Candelina mexicana]
MSTSRIPYLISSTSTRHDMTTLSVPAFQPVYPLSCFSASQTFNSWAKLTAADVHALRTVPEYEGWNIYFYSNHPINYVKLVGVLVGFDDFTNEKWGFMELDDGSGATIEIKWAKPPPLPALAADKGNELLDGQEGIKGHTVTKEADIKTPKQEIKNSAGERIDINGIDLGSVVKVKGTIDSFRGVRQIVLQRISTFFPDFLSHLNSAVISVKGVLTAWEELNAFRTSVLSKPWYLSSEAQQQLELEEQKRERRKKQKKRREIERENRRASRMRRDSLRVEERHQRRGKVRNEGEGARERGLLMRASTRDDPRQKESKDHNSHNRDRTGSSVESSAVKAKIKRRTKRQKHDRSV